MVEPLRGRSLRVVFCGTPQFAVPVLDAVAGAGHAIELVLTQPDRPSGRGMQAQASPVKQWAVAHGVSIAQPEKIRNNEPLRAQLEAMAPDAIVVVAYGRILPLWMLRLPPLGCINLHGSLLPQYRGAAPIQWAVANGDAITGVTTMLLEEGLDTGPTIEQAELAIDPADTAVDLFERLALLGAPLMVSTLAGMATGAAIPQPQNAALVSHAPLLTRADGQADFRRSASTLFNRWRGFQPWPGLWTTLEGKKFTLIRVTPYVTGVIANMLPGQLRVQEGRLLVACGNGAALELLEVQAEGRRAMPAAEFLRGHPRLAEQRLG